MTQMRNVDVRTVDPLTLVDRKEVHVNERLPKEQRVRQFAKAIRNPYCYLDEGVVVKVSFSEGTETIEDRLIAYVRSC